MVRIGMDARYAFRSQRRGIGQYVAEILSGLARVDTGDTFILYVDARADIGSLALPEGRFQLRRLAARNPMIFEEIALPLAARRDRLDLLHLTSNYGPTFPPCPTLYTVHDLIEFLRRELGPWQMDWRHHYGRAVRVRTLPWQARRARGIIVPSAATRRDVLRILGVSEDRIWTVPFGAPRTQPTPPEDARRRLRGRGYPVPEEYILGFAALDPRKNWRLAVEAFERVVPDRPEAELWLVGIEDSSAYPPDSPPWLRLFSYLSRDDAMDLLQGATAFVYPSLYEGFGFPALEAMSLGVPVIASDSTSIPEVVGEAGILFPAKSHDALASAMLHILQDRDLCTDLSRQGRERAAAFRWDDAVAHHVEIYHRVGGAA